MNDHVLFYYKLKYYIFGDFFAGDMENSFVYILVYISVQVSADSRLFLL